jgi:hypothetical protein
MTCVDESGSIRLAGIRRGDWKRGTYRSERHFSETEVIGRFPIPRVSPAPETPQPDPDSPSYRVQKTRGK